MMDGDGGDGGGDCGDVFSAWSRGGVAADGAALVRGTPPKRLEINGAPVIEQSHQYVLDRPTEFAVEAQKLLGISLEGSVG